jgi:hypothetical protein
MVPGSIGCGLIQSGGKVHILATSIAELETYRFSLCNPEPFSMRAKCRTYLYVHMRVCCVAKSQSALRQVLSCGMTGVVTIMRAS